MIISDEFYFVALFILIVGRIFNFIVWWPISKKIVSKNQVIVYLIASLLCPMIVSIIIWIIACKPKVLRKESYASSEIQKYKEELMKIK